MIVLTSADFSAAAAEWVSRSKSLRDRLNEADARLGDGDTGMTVARMVEAIHEASRDLPSDIGECLRIWGRACAQASGSSLAAVVSMALARAARHARGQNEIDRAALAVLLRHAADAIVERSGAAPGDKTILDSLLSVQAALDAGAGSSSEAALRGVDDALDDFRSRQARLGRARMYGERSIGLDDPGMLAASLLLHAALDPAAGEAIHDVG